MRLCVKAAALLLLLLSLSGCSLLPSSVTEEGTLQETVESFEREVMGEALATEADKADLEKLYGSRIAFHGDMHDHSSVGDGHEDLTTWKTNLEALNMDFQAILDHRQVKHMYLPEWDDTLFIGGTEAAAGHLHYNMIVPDVKVLEEILQTFPSYEFTGGKEGVAMEDGRFDYPSLGREKIQQIISILREKGGMFVHAHPKQSYHSAPSNYWYADYTGLEVFYKDYSSKDSKENYELWCSLLSLGKRVWATAGCDRHRVPDAKALTTIYAESTLDDHLLSHASQGDFTCGFVGIRMAIGETKMGSSTDFNGKRLVLSVGDFYESFAREGRAYRVDIIDDKGVVASLKMSDFSTHYYALNASEEAAFYRVEVHDDMRKGATLIAIGQPIWND